MSFIEHSSLGLIIIVGVFIFLMCVLYFWGDE